MRRMMSVLAGLTALCIFGPAPAAAEQAAWTAHVCSAGPAGDHPAGRDNDGDGVPDSEDWCIASKPGERVGSNGCAAGEIAVNCGKAPAPQVAAAIPAPIVPAPGVRDSDGDGVPDSDDQCPGTPRGVAVDRRGCVLIESVVLKGVSFGSGSAVLQPGASATLRGVASAMKVNPGLKVEIEGHTDSVGLAAKNQTLSTRRAQAVKNFLVKEGVAADRLSAVGHGSAKPVDSNDTAAGRANNRRVEFKVVR